jgi:hypothetical protein
MQDENSKFRQELEVLSQSLGLPYEPQDWGIINANGIRLPEFIAYYETNLLSSVQKVELAELIIASANECLLGKLSLPERFPIFPNRNLNGIKNQLEYWRNLESDLEFPIASWLRANT